MADRPPRFRRRLLTAALIGLGMLAVAAAGLWLLLPTIAAGIVTDRLEKLGVPEPRIALVTIGLDRAVAHGVAAGTGDELTIEEVAVTYRWPDLLDGAVQSITLRNVDLAASIDGGRLSLGSLDPLLAPGDGGGGLPSLPPIELDGATVTLDTGFGAVTLRGSGHVAGSDGAISAELDIAAAAPQGSASGHLTASLSGSTAQARLVLAESAIEFAGLATLTGSGEISARLDGGELAALDAGLEIAGLRLDDPRLAKLGALSGPLTVSGGDQGWNAAARLADAPESLSIGLRLATDAPSLEGPVTVALDLDAAASAPLWQLAGLPEPDAGRLSAQLVGEVTPARLLDSGTGLPPLAFSLALELDRIAVDGIVRSVSATAGIDVEAAGGTIRLSAAAPILAELAVDPAIVEGRGIPPGAATLLDRPLAVSLELAGPAEIALKNGATVDAAPTVTADLADGRRLLGIGGRLHLSAGDGGPVTLQLSSLDGRLDVPTETGLPEMSLALAGDASVAGTDGTAALQLSATAPKAALGRLRATDLRLDMPLSVEFGDSRLSARLTGPGLVSAGRVAGTAPLTLAGPVQLPFIPGDVPLLVMELADPRAPRASIDLSAGPLDIAGAIEAEHGRIDSGLSLPHLDLHAGLGEAGWSGGLAASGGTLAVPTYQVEATALDLVAELPAGGAPEITLNAAVSHRGDPAFLVPLSASLTARQAGRHWTFTGHAADAFGRISIDVEGRHDPARNVGSGTLRVAPIEFAPNLRQPGDLAPFLAELAEEVSGTIALAGDLSWSAEGIASDLELLLRNVSATTHAAVIDRLNGVIEVDGLQPFSTKPGQRVAVAALDVGLPLTDGLLTFRVTPAGRLEIAGGRLRFAGGTVDLEPLTFDPGGDSNAAVLAVTGVELGQLLALAQVDGLTGDGKLTGRIPVRIGKGEVVIENGRLEAEGPGRLSYAPLEPPAALQGQGETVSLALSALTDFQYEQLWLTIDRQAGGEMTVGMHVRGKNPDFYDGYPVEFNLNVSGALDRVLRQSLAGYRIPEAIEEQLQDFAQ